MSRQGSRGSSGEYQADEQAYRDHGKVTYRNSRMKTVLIGGDLQKQGESVTGHDAVN